MHFLNRSVENGALLTYMTAPNATPGFLPSADDLLDVQSAPPGQPALMAETQTVTFHQPLKLQSGEVLPTFTLAYQIYGTLNRDQSNAILVCHALSGDAHAAGVDPATGKPGWWDNMIGPGKGMDTNRHFVISCNCLGGCKGSTGPSSINPATGKPYAREFPVITMADMVEAQKRLVDHLGIRTLLAVIGGSMGGMQVLEWAVRFPDRVRAALPIATTTRLNAQAIAFNAVGRNAILSDHHYQDGRYYPQSGGHEPGPDEGLSIARMVGHITYLSEESMHAKFGRRLRERDKFGFDFQNEFSIETYLDYQGNKFVERFDANSYLYITKAMDYFDLACWSLEGTSAVTSQHDELSLLTAVLTRVQARFLVVSFSSDWLFTPAQSRVLVNALLTAQKDVSYCNIQSPYGHDAFLLEPQALGRLISGFLAGVEGKTGEGQGAGGKGREVKGHVVVPVGTGSATRTTPRTSASPPTDPLRVDYDTIENLVEPGSSVLDLGCASGELLYRLIRDKNVRGCGLELEQESVIRAIEKGLTVHQCDIDAGLPQYRNQQFDYVILSQTLQVTRRPDVVIKEMLRVGRRGIVSFPNFGHWKSRLQLAFAGYSPRTEFLPFEWYDSPNIRFLSLLDFEHFCRQSGAKILERIPLVGWSRERVRWWPNLRAEEAVYLLAGGE